MQQGTFWSQAFSSAGDQLHIWDKCRRAVPLGAEQRRTNKAFSPKPTSLSASCLRAWLYLEESHFPFGASPFSKLHTLQTNAGALGLKFAGRFPINDLIAWIRLEAMKDFWRNIRHFPSSKRDLAEKGFSRLFQDSARGVRAPVRCPPLKGPWLSKFSGLVSVKKYPFSSS